MTWIYALECVGGRFYIGIAEDAVVRIRRHCLRRGALFTRLFAPTAFVAAISLPDHATAAQLEYRLKKLPRAEKVAFFRELVDAAEQSLDAPIPLPGIFREWRDDRPSALVARVFVDLTKVPSADPWRASL